MGRIVKVLNWEGTDHRSSNHPIGKHRPHHPPPHHHHHSPLQAFSKYFCVVTLSKSSSYYIQKAGGHILDSASKLGCLPPLFLFYCSPNNIDPFGMLPFDAAYKPPIAVMDGHDTELLVASPPCRESIILDLPPSCIDFSHQHPCTFVVGTYYLEPQPSSHTTPSQQNGDQVQRPVQDRRGSLTLFRFSATNGL